MKFSTLTESRNLVENNEESFVGRPLKSFLMTISPTARISIDYKTTGDLVSPQCGGFGGRVNQVGWYIADRFIVEVKATPDSRFYDYVIVID